MWRWINRDVYMTSSIKLGANLYRSHWEQHIKNVWSLWKNNFVDKAIWWFGEVRRDGKGDDISCYRLLISIWTWLQKSKIREKSEAICCLRKNFDVTSRISKIEFLKSLVHSFRKAYLIFAMFVLQTAVLNKSLEMNHFDRGFSTIEYQS